MIYIKSLIVIFLMFPLAVMSQIESSKNKAKDGNTLNSHELGTKISPSHMNSKDDKEDDETKDRQGAQNYDSGSEGDFHEEISQESNQLVSAEGDFYVQRRAHGIFWFIGTFLVLLFAVFVLI